MKEVLQKYLNVFQKLRVDRSHGIAPHKPILLLSVLQTFHNGINNTNRIYLTPELVALFKSNWSSLVNSKHDCRISYPFYYLKSDKFWKLVPKLGFENIDNLGSIAKSFSNFNSAIEYAIIDEDLFDLMINQTTNEILQQFLLHIYFPETNYKFINSNKLQQKLFDDIENKILNEPSEVYRQEIRNLLEQKNEEEIFLRGSLFKREIPKIYNNTCCISGMRVDAITSVSMIDACHIVPFSLSYDDTITNGIALCPNLHRAFDRGLITINKDYKVIVSKSFKENESVFAIKTFEGKEIKLPYQKDYFPLKENLEWHRLNIFK